MARAAAPPTSAEKPLLPRRRTRGASGLGEPSVSLIVHHLLKNVLCPSPSLPRPKVLSTKSRVPRGRSNRPPHVMKARGSSAGRPVTCEVGRDHDLASRQRFGQLIARRPQAPRLR